MELRKTEEAWIFNDSLAQEAKFRVLNQELEGISKSYMSWNFIILGVIKTMITKVLVEVSLVNSRFKHIIVKVSRGSHCMQYMFSFLYRKNYKYFTGYLAEIVQ